MKTEIIKIINSECMHESEFKHVFSLSRETYKLTILFLQAFHTTVRESIYKNLAHLSLSKQKKII